MKTPEQYAYELDGMETENTRLRKSMADEADLRQMQSNRIEELRAENERLRMLTDVIESAERTEKNENARLRTQLATAINERDCLHARSAASDAIIARMVADCDDYRTQLAAAREALKAVVTALSYGFDPIDPDIPTSEQLVAKCKAALAAISGKEE
jgi:uncharacterized protein YhaN